MLLNIVVLIASYLMGSIPTGLWVVRLTTGKDVRKVESGRTGGTNVMRAAGFWAGFVTAVVDIFKATAAVLISRWLTPENAWMDVLAPTLAVFGHNYSIFLLERTESGGFRLRGGAGGASCVGGSLGLWWPSVFVIVPIGVFVLYFIGYASLATLSVALVSTLLFAYLALTNFGDISWVYAVYGILTGLLMAWSLRPNIQRLLNGTERIVGYRVRNQKKS